MTAERILVLGNHGLLGQAVVNALGPDCLVIPGGSRELDLAAAGADDAQTADQAAKEINERIRAERPSRVINCTGYTKVDSAETEPDLAYAVNAAGAEAVARACRACGAHFTHLSTDYVFDGKKGSPYKETDQADPLSIYAASKLEGEKRVLGAWENSLIVRTAWLFGPGRADFTDKILAKTEKNGNIDVVRDEVGSPTYSLDLAGALAALARKKVTGLLHVVNTGKASRVELARQVLRLKGLDPLRINPVPSESMRLPAARPKCSVLDTRRFSRITGSALPSWFDALKRHLMPGREVVD